MTHLDIPLAIVGPTAAGKSALALAVAEADTRVEILSADSMQVYRGMDIGTAKATAAEQGAVRHHLIDLLEPHEDYSLSRFVDDATAAVADVRSRGNVPVLVGGTGLYVRALVDDLEIPGQYPEVRAELEADPDVEALHARLAQLDPVGAERMEPNNQRRVVRALEVTLGSGRPFSSFGPGLAEYATSPIAQVACDRARPVLDLRIDQRYLEQMEDGFLDEVKALVEPGKPAISKTARQALGYKELLEHVEDDMALEEALSLAARRTRRFARRQQRWFRRDERIEWFDLDQHDHAAVVAHCTALLT